MMGAPVRAERGSSPFLRRRWEALLDNAIWAALLAGGGALIGIAVAFGSEDARLPVLLVVLFGLVQAACVTALVVLFRRLGSGPEADPARLEAPHSHAELLARIDALDRSVAELHQNDPIAWAVARTFNELLNEARAATDHSALANIDEFTESGSYAYSGDNGTLRTLLGQVRSVVGNTR